MVLVSSLAHKKEKAQRYAQEPKRFNFRAFRVTIQGDNGDHEVSLDEGKWQCDCVFFANYQRCAHTMAMEELLGEMLKA